MTQPLSPLHVKYVRSFPEKMSDLKEALRLSKDTNDLHPLHHLVHKLAGSSGLYGFDEVSLAARSALKRITSEQASIESIAVDVEKICTALDIAYQANKD